MGEARFNGMHSHAKGINAQGKHVPGTQQYTYTDPWSFTGGLELDDILSLQNNRILLAPAEVPQPSVDVAALVQQSVSQDPHGHSLHGSTTRKLKQAPADHHGFGV